MRMDRISADVRQAARSLAESPSFTSIAVLSLGMALALNTTMFALVDAVRHPPSPYPEPERLVVPTLFGGDRDRPISFEERYRAIEDGSDIHEAMASYTLVPAFVQTPTVAENQYVAAVTPNFFTVVGVRSLKGRTFGRADESTASAPVAIVSYRLWRRFFPGRALEEHPTLDVGGRLYTVVGVQPRGVHFPLETDVWVPVASLTGDTSLKRVGPIPVLRLRPGVTPQMARRVADVVAVRLSADRALRHPLAARVLTAGASPGSLRAFPPFISPTLTLVLIIACANLATMMLARGATRRRETAIRIALGASRRDIVVRVLVECALIVAGGAAIGALLTGWALYLVPHFATPYLPALGDIDVTPSWRVFAFVLAASVAVLLLSSVLPAIRAAGTNPAEPLKDGAGSTVRVRDRYDPLIVAEVALSTALLMSCAMFALFAARLASYEFRFAAERLVVANLDASGKYVRTDADVERFYADLINRARRLSRARYAATRYTEQPDGLVVYGEQGRGGALTMWLDAYTVVSPDYLRTLGIPVLHGRDFEPGDRGQETGSVIVDETTARRLWPNFAHPVGRMVRLGRPGSLRPWMRVVGVARAVDLRSIREAQGAVPPAIYVVNGRDVARRRDLVVQGDGVNGDRGREALTRDLAREIQTAAPWLRMPKVTSWLFAYERAREMTGFLASLFAALSAFGLVLCAVGLYGVLSVTVSRRQREFAVRTALGARPGDIARLVLHDATVTALAGIGIGAFLALSMTRAISVPLNAVRFADAKALVLAELVLLAVAFAAALMPVRRATRADPVRILRAN